EASMLFHPAIEEPSKKCPLSNLSIVKALSGTETCCSLPLVSIKRRSTNLTSLSLIIFMTSLADIAIAGSPRFADCWWGYEGNRALGRWNLCRFHAIRRKKGRPLCHKRALNAILGGGAPNRRKAVIMRTASVRINSDRLVWS